jgi:hypothetical protein
MMRRSLAIVQPSQFEGWSTVVEDTRALGKTCILSAIAVHREQNPPGAVYFASDSPRELADRMAEGWERLSPGPDPASEEAARKRADERIVEVGRNFLEIARRAISVKS